MDGASLFGYARINPLSATDPMGLDIGSGGEDWGLGGGEDRSRDGPLTKEDVDRAQEDATYKFMRDNGVVPGYIYSIGFEALRQTGVDPLVAISSGDPVEAVPAILEFTIFRLGGRLLKRCARFFKRADNAAPPVPLPSPRYPRNPDDWTPPPGWKETPAGDRTGGRHRQWVDETGTIRRRWDREGRPGGKDRDEHWHDMDDPSGGTDHIDPDD